MTAPDLPAIIARLRRTQPRNQDTMTVCDALQDFLQAPISASRTYDEIQQAYCDAIDRFDRVKYHRSYQRTYMRDARAAKKLGITTAEYRKRD